MEVRMETESSQSSQNIKRKTFRRMSFSSAAIAGGNMPDSVGMNDPTIQVLMHFDNYNACPTESDLVEIVQRLFEFDRLRGIPTKISTKRWISKPVESPVDPKKMIRIIDVSNSNVDSMALVQDQRSFLLRAKSRNLPWWEFCLIKNKGRDESVLILRVDHAIGDGLSIGKICASFLTNRDGTTLHDFVPPSMISNKEEVRTQNIFKIVMKSIYALFKIASLPFSRCDHGTVFAKNSLGSNMKVRNTSRIVQFNEIPLNFLKRIKGEANVSLNTVLVTCLGNAIYELCANQRCPIVQQFGEKTRCRALMMFGFPNKSMEKNNCIHNKMAAVSMKLPFGDLENIHRRLLITEQRMSGLKKSFIAPMELVLINKILPLLPLSLYRIIAYKIASRHNLTYTSVPGPEEEVFIAGKRVSACRSAVTGHIHPIISMLSYNNNMSITLVADESIPGLDLLSAFFIGALENLAQKYGIDVPSKIQLAIDKTIS